MRIAVIGGTRGIGLQFVEQALDAGHDIRALVRRPDAFPVTHSSLSVVKGDLMDQPSVNLALENQEVVLLTAGAPPSLRRISLFSEGSRNVIAAMNANRIRRIFVVTGIGAGDSRGHGGFLYDRIFQPLLLKRIYEDKDRQEALFRSSQLDWTILRPGFLNDRGVTGQYRVVTDLEGYRAGHISRADVAHFVLSQLGSAEYVGKTVMLS